MRALDELMPCNYRSLLAPCGRTGISSAAVTKLTKLCSLTVHRCARGAGVSLQGR